MPKLDFVALMFQIKVNWFVSPRVNLKRFGKSKVKIIIINFINSIESLGKEMTS